jgi:hypothetical protein
MVVEVTIKQQIAAMLENTAGGDLEAAKQQFATDLAQIIATAIRSATVTVQPGIAVQVAVPAGTGVTTGPGTGSLQ